MSGIGTTNDFDISNADGVTTVFTYTFFAYDASQVKVYSVLNDVETAITSGITITPNSSFIGGTVTFAAAPLSGVGKILRRREVPYTQLTELKDLTTLKESAYEKAFNTLAMQIQQVFSKVSRSLKFSEAAGTTAAVVGTPVDGKTLIFDGLTGLIVAGPDAADITTANASAISAAASAATASAASTAAQAANGGIGRVARLATAGNVTLSGLQTIDGVVGADGDRIFVRGQSTAAQNGIYIMASGAWARASDANTWSSFLGMLCTITEGTNRKHHVYISLATQGGTLGSTSINFDTVPIDGHVGTEKITFNPLLNDFRLTPTSGTPVVTGDANAVGTLYMTPYKGNQIALYNGTRWNVRVTPEISISLATTSANNAYDVFCYDNAGTPTLELQVWSTSTARSVALVYQDGVLVRSGATTRRYLGSFYCHTNGQTASSLTNTGATTGRYIFNYYNRVLLRMQRFESTASWAYNTNAYRQANGSTVNQLNFFIGVIEDAVNCSQIGLANIVAVNSGATTAIGLNSTTAVQSGSQAFLNSMVSSFATCGSSTINVTPTLGLNYLAWIEYGNATGCTFFGSAYLCGINGAVFC